jgi:hypothetical protein
LVVPGEKQRPGQRNGIRSRGRKAREIKGMVVVEVLDVLEVVSGGTPGERL